MLNEFWLIYLRFLGDIFKEHILLTLLIFTQYHTILYNTVVLTKCFHMLLYVIVTGRLGEEWCGRCYSRWLHFWYLRLILQFSFLIVWNKMWNKAEASDCSYSARCFHSLTALIEACSCNLRRTGEIKTCPPPSSEALSAGCAVSRMTHSAHKAYDSIQWQYSLHSVWEYVWFPNDTLGPIMLAVFTFSTSRSSQLTMIHSSHKDRWIDSSIAQFPCFVAIVVVSRFGKIKPLVFLPVDILIVAISTDKLENSCLCIWCLEKVLRCSELSCHLRGLHPVFWF